MGIDPTRRHTGRIREPRAGDLFTDRETESQAFKAALAWHRRTVDSPGSDGGCDNVLVFYGVGGVGKTTLSERLQAWVERDLPLVNGWGPPPDTVVQLTVRHDLHDGLGRFDVVKLLLAIRMGLGSVRKRWPAFDLAFAAYWAASHPGESYPLDEPAARELSDTISSTILDLAGDLQLPGTPIGLGVRGIRRIVEALSARAERARALASYEGYGDLLRDCTDLPSTTDPRLDVAAELALPLAYELGELESTPMIVVFIDTYEKLALDPRRVGESLLNRVVWLMPNVLFVVTGRNMLSWHDTAETRLSITGPAAWPGLLPGAIEGPRQHLVGYLSDDDTRWALRKGRELFELPIDDELIERIVVASGGLPQYLDLVRSVAMSAKIAGRRVGPEDVTGSLPDLVARVFEDIPSDERRALWGACLFPCFDAELMAAAGGVDVGCAERALLRPMIDQSGREDYPFRMHDNVREALRSVGYGVPGGWAEPDWRAAATRGLRAVRQRFEAASQNGGGVPAMTALGLAVNLVCDVETDIDSGSSSHYSDWLSQAIVFAPSIAGLRQYLPVRSSTRYGETVLSFVRAKARLSPHSEQMSAVDRRAVAPQWISATEQREILRSIFDSDHPLATPAGRHLAYSLRNNGHWVESIAVFDALIERSPSEVHMYQRAFTYAHARRFRDATARLAELTDERRSSLTALIAHSHGSPLAWLESREVKAAKLQAAGKHREHLEALGAQYRWSAILTGDVRSLEADELLGEAESVGHNVAMRDALTTLVLLDPTDTAATSGYLDRLAVLDEAANDGELGGRTAMASVVAAYARGDREELRRLRDQIGDKKIPRSRMWIAVECLLDSLALPVPDTPTQWVEPYETVRDRWWSIFETYRVRHSDHGIESVSGPS